MTKKSTFTIIELLIIFAIIAILISLLQPSLRKITTHARLLNCTKNLKLITYGHNNYLQDHSNIFIRESYNFDGRRYYRNNEFVIERFGNYQVTYDAEYLDNKTAFHCPTSFRQNAWGRPYDDAEAFSYDYALNSHLYGNALESIAEPSKVMTNTDTNYEWMHRGVGWRIDVRHGSDLNHLWADGHVSNMHYLDFYNNFQWINRRITSPTSWNTDFTIRDN